LWAMRLAVSRLGHADSWSHGSRGSSRGPGPDVIDHRRRCTLLLGPWRRCSTRQAELANSDWISVRRPSPQGAARSKAGNAGKGTKPGEDRLDRSSVTATPVPSGVVCWDRHRQQSHSRLRAANRRRADRVELEFPIGCDALRQPPGTARGRSRIELPEAEDAEDDEEAHDTGERNQTLP